MSATPENSNTVPPTENPASVPPPPPQPAPLNYQAAAGQTEMNAQARTFGMLCHLLAFCTLVMPLGSILGPLVMWLLKKNEYPFVDDQGKESLNFQITVLIAFCVSAVLMFAFIGFLLTPAVVITAIVMVIIASIKASNGEYYRYPINIRFIK